MSTRTFIITVVTDRPDPEPYIREAAEMLACQIDWDNDATTVIEAVEAHNDGQFDHVSTYYMEPGQ